MKQQQRLIEIKYLAGSLSKAQRVRFLEIALREWYAGKQAGPRPTLREVTRRREAGKR